MADATAGSSAMRRTWLPRAAILLLAAAIASASAACGANDESPRGPGRQLGLGGASSEAGGAAGSTAAGLPGCIDGDVQECHFTLGQHGSVLSCFDGKQVCEGGLWGPCADGTVSNKV